MKTAVLLSLLALGAFPVRSLAQTTNIAANPPVPQLNDTQILGRRMFQQRCAACHTESTPGARRYGPVLYKELITGNEDTITQLIRNGSPGKMPGFKYGMEDREIRAMVEYLKTVPRPARTSGPVKEGPLD
jgi:mono/diheme cytochrome c family protein